MKRWGIITLMLFAFVLGFTMTYNCGGGSSAVAEGEEVLTIVGSAFRNGQSAFLGASVTLVNDGDSAYYPLILPFSCTLNQIDIATREFSDVGALKVSLFKKDVDPLDIGQEQSVIFSIEGGSPADTGFIFSSTGPISIPYDPANHIYTMRAQANNGDNMDLYWVRLYCEKP